MSQNWNAILAARTVNVKPSVFVDLADLWKIEDLIFFAGGTPAVETVPIERLRQATADAWEDAYDIFSYGEGQGYEPLRSQIAGRMSARGADVDADQVIVTNGSQQGIDLIARILFDPGDVVIVEGPTYFGALQAFDPYSVRYRIAPVDEHGIIPVELERLVRKDPRPKALYTISIFQNPTGVTISPERQRQIIEIAADANLAIIEDDPYGELHFGSEPMPPLRALSDDVIYLGTFSKTLFPALRMGWLVAPEPVRSLVKNAKEAVDIQSDRFVQRAVARATADGWFDAHLGSARKLYQHQCSCMLVALEREMPSGTNWTRPRGGFFIWLTLPHEFSADDLLPIAAAERVGFLPGSSFYPDRRRVPALRLGFSTLPQRRINEGIERLGRALRTALDET